MNQLQIATAIGQRLGTDCSDPTSRDGAAVRQFIQLRHDQLYKSFLWKDSILEYVLAIDTAAADYVPTDNYMPTKGHLILPPIISKVLACRTSENKLDVERPMVYFRVNPDEFTQTGTPLGFYLLSACAWEFDVAEAILLAAVNPADNGVACTLDELQPDGVTVTRNQVGAASPGAAVAGTTDRLDNFIKPATQGAVSIVLGAQISTAGITYAGAPIPTAVLPVTPGQTYKITPGANENGMILVNGAQQITLATGNQVTVVAQGASISFQYPDLIPTGTNYVGINYLPNVVNGVAYTVILGANEYEFVYPMGMGPPGSFPAPGTYQYISTLTGNSIYLYFQARVANTPITGSLYAAATNLPLTAAVVGVTISATILTLQAANLIAPLCQRIRLMPLPNTNTTVRVLAKRVTPPFSADTDSPGISGLDGILFALGYYDFLSRKERGGTPDAVAALTDAVGPNFLAKNMPGGFLKILIDEEVFQAAHESRIMPDSGFGDPSYYGSNETATKTQPY